jgi:hypothetical protein
MRFTEGPVAAGATIRVGIAAQGSALRFYRDGRQLGEAPDSSVSPGRVVLGIFQTDGAPPFSVTFRDIEIWTPSG